MGCLSAHLKVCIPYIVIRNDNLLDIIPAKSRERSECFDDLEVLPDLHRNAVSPAYIWKGKMLTRFHLFLQAFADLGLPPDVFSVPFKAVSHLTYAVDLGPLSSQCPLAFREAIVRTSVALSASVHLLASLSGILWADGCKDVRCWEM